MAAVTVCNNTFASPFVFVFSHLTLVVLRGIFGVQNSFIPSIICFTTAILHGTRWACDDFSSDQHYGDGSIGAAA